MSWLLTGLGVGYEAALSAPKAACRFPPVVVTGHLPPRTLLDGLRHQRGARTCCKLHGLRTAANALIKSHFSYPQSGNRKRFDTEHCINYDQTGENSLW